MRFVVPICRSREIVKQIGACKWRPDAHAISVRHVGRFGKSLWSLHRFSRDGADFTAQAYVSLRKMADVESKSVRKKRSFDEKEINLLILLGLACLSERYRDSKITSETTLVLWYKYFLYLLQLTTLVVTSSLDSNSPQLLVSHTYL